MGPLKTDSEGTANNQRVQEQSKVKIWMSRVSHRERQAAIQYCQKGLLQVQKRCRACAPSLKAEWSVKWRMTRKKYCMPLTESALQSRLRSDKIRLDGM